MSMNFLDSIRKGLDRASFETDKLMRYNRVHAEAARLHAEAADKTRQLGDRVLALYKAGTLNVGELAALAREIEDLQARAKQKEDEATEIQAEVWIEPPDVGGPAYTSPSPPAGSSYIPAAPAYPSTPSVSSYPPVPPMPAPVYPSVPAPRPVPPITPPVAPPAAHHAPTHLEDQGTRRVPVPQTGSGPDYCPNCGGPLRPHAAFCAQCGIRL